MKSQPVFAVESLLPIRSKLLCVQPSAIRSVFHVAGLSTVLTISVTWRSLVVVACVVLIGLGAARAGLLVGHTPLLGLANNYDMIRVQGCIDAYPVRDPQTPPWANSWQAPIAKYEFREDINSGCFASTESLLAVVLLPSLRFLASDDGSFPLRAVGWAKVALLLTLSALACVALTVQGSRLAALVCALLALTILADPMVTVYFNSFYAEGTAALFAFATVACMIAATRTSRAPYWLLIVVPVLLLAVAMTKIQHVVFGPFVTAWILIVARRNRCTIARSALLAICAGAAVGFAAQFVHMQSAATASISQANATNTYLMAVLAESPDPSLTTARLGLPVHCANAAGKSWFDEGVQESHPCPEVFGLNRLILVKLAVSEPVTVVRVLAKGLMLSRPWIPVVLGKVEGENSAPLPEAFFSVDRLVNAIPTWLYAVLILAPVPIVILALAFKDAVSFTALSALGITGTYPLIALTTVVFGDGFADVAKQFHLGAVSLACFWLILGVLLVIAAARDWRSSDPPGRA